MLAGALRDEIASRCETDMLVKGRRESFQAAGFACSTLPWVTLRGYIYVQFVLVISKPGLAVMISV
jgi:hypothetical protein